MPDPGVSIFSAGEKMFEHVCSELRKAGPVL